MEATKTLLNGAGEGDIVAVWYYNFLRYLSDRGISKSVFVSVRQEGINIAATGDLNLDGVNALESALTIAKHLKSASSLLSN